MAETPHGDTQLGRRWRPSHGVQSQDAAARSPRRQRGPAKVIQLPLWPEAEARRAQCGACAVRCSRRCKAKIARIWTGCSCSRPRTVIAVRL